MSYKPAKPDVHMFFWLIHAKWEGYASNAHRYASAIYRVKCNLRGASQVMEAVLENRFMRVHELHLIGELQRLILFTRATIRNVEE